MKNHPDPKHRPATDPSQKSHPLCAHVGAIVRAQLTALNADIQQRATQAQLAAEIAGTSANTNGVALLGMTVSDPPTQAEMQAIADKLDELINAHRR